MNQILPFTEIDLLRLPGIGHVNLKTLSEFFSSKGLSLASSAEMGNEIDGCIKLLRSNGYVVLARWDYERPLRSIEKACKELGEARK